MNKVIVITKNEGFIYGRCVHHDVASRYVELRDVVDLSNDIKLFLRESDISTIVTCGPRSDIELPPMIKGINVYDVVAIVECSEAAAAAFEKNR